MREGKVSWYMVWRQSSRDGNRLSAEGGQKGLSKKSAAVRVLAFLGGTLTGEQKLLSGKSEKTLVSPVQRTM